MSIFSDQNVLRFVTSSSGADDAGKIPQLNAAGTLDSSFISGSGSTIIVQDEGVMVGGGSFGTLNFTGAGVVATDAGAGVADITIAGGGASTLQAAYDGGNTIATSGGDNVLISGTEAFQITAAGGLDVDTTFDFDGTDFDVSVTGGGDITLTSVTGNHLVSAGAGVNGAITLDATAGGVQIDAVSLVDINCATFDLDATADADITASTFDLDATTIEIDSVGTTTVTAGSVFSLNSSPVGIPGTSNITSSGSSVTSTGITIFSDNAGGGALANSFVTINAVNSGLGATSSINIGSNAGPGARTDRIGFFGAIGVGPGAGTTTVTGSRGGNAALTSLIGVLTAYGLIVNSTTP